LELDFLSYREETVASLPKVQNKDDIPEPWQNFPIGLLLQYHNLGRPSDPYEKPELLVSMCMDNRKSLRIPDKFAYIMRTGVRGRGGLSPEGSQEAETKVSQGTGGTAYV
jgi:carbonic anhydrase